MSKYLCTVDLDGTLLTDNKKIKNKTKRFIKKWIKKGNIFAMSTGRPYTGSLHIYKMLGLDIPLITDNGAAIYFLNETRKFFPIPKDRFNEYLLDTYELSKIIYMTTSNNEGLTKNKEDLPRWIIHDECDEYRLIENSTIEDIYNHEVLIYNCWVEDSKYEEFTAKAKKYMNDFFYYDWGIWDGYHFIEIHSKDSSKGHALKYLKEYYKIDDDKTIAFGDQMNDMSMLEVAYYGVGMINGVKDVLNNTKYHTDYDNNHNGLIKFIKKNKLM